MAIEYEKGYLILATNTEEVDYVSCAIELANSIKKWHPDAKICLLSDQLVTVDSIDISKLFPLEKSTLKFGNDWQSFYASPFRQTIKLEADMIATSPIDHWWTLFEHRDVVISRGARNFYDELANSRFYRKIFDNNHLPDLYNAITYWRYSKTALDFFHLTRQIFHDWAIYKTLLKFPDEEPTTDVVYAMAANIMGPEKVTLPEGYGPTIVHMKRYMIPISTEDWTKELIWESTNNCFKIQTIAQHGFVHYHIKEWANDYRNNREFLESLRNTSEAN